VETARGTIREADRRAAFGGRYVGRAAVNKTDLSQNVLLTAAYPTQSRPAKQADRRSASSQGFELARSLRVSVSLWLVGR